MRLFNVWYFTFIFFLSIHCHIVHNLGYPQCHTDDISKMSFYHWHFNYVIFEQFILALHVAWSCLNTFKINSVFNTVSWRLQCLLFKIKKIFLNIYEPLTICTSACCHMLYIASDAHCLFILWNYLTVLGLVSALWHRAEDNYFVGCISFDEWDFNMVAFLFT